MKVAWVAVAFVAGTALWANIGCGDDTGSGGSAATGSSASGSESAGSGMGGTTTTGSSTGSSMGSTTGTSGSGGFAACADCTANDAKGAYQTVCKKEVDACNADAKCAALLTFAYDTCGYDGCCPIKKAMMDAIPAASVALYKAVENCATCGACKTLCADVDPVMNSTTFCATLQAANPTCP